MHLTPDVFDGTAREHEGQLTGMRRECELVVWDSS